MIRPRHAATLIESFVRDLVYGQPDPLPRRAAGTYGDVARAVRTIRASWEG